MSDSEEVNVKYIDVDIYQSHSLLMNSSKEVNMKKNLTLISLRRLIDKISSIKSSCDRNTSFRLTLTQSETFYDDDARIHFNDTWSLQRQKPGVTYSASVSLRLRCCRSGNVCASIVERTSDGTARQRDGGPCHLLSSYSSELQGQRAGLPSPSQNVVDVSYAAGADGKSAIVCPVSPKEQISTVRWSVRYATSAHRSYDPLTACHKEEVQHWRSVHVIFFRSTGREPTSVATIT